MAARRKHDTVALIAMGLGDKPDSVIAKESGIDRRTVAYIRSKLGISAFVGLILTQEGNPCRSIYEAMYDAWLHWKNQEHEHEVKVPGTSYIADFKVNGTYIEIVGMMPVKRYSDKIWKKHSEYDRLCLPTSWIGPEALEYICRDCPIPLKFRPRYCSTCNLETHDLVQGMCRPCHRKAWGKANSEAAICDQCNKSFQRPAGQPNAKFCSRDCYWASLRKPSPSWEWIDEQLKTRSVPSVASEIGMKPNTIHMRLHRRKIRQLLL